jgi:hypothetical protein
MLHLGLGDIQRLIKKAGGWISVPEKLGRSHVTNSKKETKKAGCSDF